MAELYLNFKKNGVAELTTKPSYRDTIFFQMKQNLRLTSKPIFKTAIVYRDTGKEQKYWDVGMPVKGTGADIIAVLNAKK